MAENNEDMSFATAGSGKSPEEIAFDLVNKLKGQGVWGERNMPAILDMYAECLDAARGLRAYPGQNRVEVPISQGASGQAQQAAPVQEPAQEPASVHDAMPAAHAQPATEQSHQAPEMPPMPNHTFNNVG